MAPVLIWSCVTGIGVAAVAAIGYLVYLDSKRISSPGYRADVEERRRLARIARLQSRLAALPQANDADGIKTFVVYKFRRAKYGAQTAADVEEAAENIADALCVLSAHQVDRLLDRLKSGDDPTALQTYDKVCEKYAEMKSLQLSIT